MGWSTVRVTIVSGNSVTLREQGSVVTAVTVHLALDCLLITRWMRLYTNPKWPFVKEEITGFQLSTDGYMFAKILGITMGCIRCGGIPDMTSLSCSLFPDDRGRLAIF